MEDLKKPYAIVKTQIEDLEFLKNNILHNNNFIENDNVFALSRSGLMRQSSWSYLSNLDQQKYVFTPLAFKVARFSLFVNDRSRIKLLKEQEKAPKTRLQNPSHSYMNVNFIT